jgi:hypothetical protein
MPSTHTTRIINTNGGGAIGQQFSGAFQASNAINIKRISGSSDGAGTRMFNNIPGNTNLGSVKSQIATSSFNYIQKPFSAGTFGSVVAGFALTQTRRNPGDSTLASAKPLSGIVPRVALGGLRTYSVIKTYNLAELDKSLSTNTRWTDLYGRVLEVNGSNIRLLIRSQDGSVVKDANSEITSTTFTADVAPGTKTYSDNKGLVYYSKLSASAQPKIMTVAEGGVSSSKPVAGG